MTLVPDIRHHRRQIVGEPVRIPPDGRVEPCPALAGAPEGRGPIRVPYNAVVLVAFAGIIAAAIGFASILAVTVAFLAGAVAAGIAAIAAPVALPLSACYDSLLTPRGIAGRYPLLTATAGTPAS